MKIRTTLFAAVGCMFSLTALAGGTLPKPKLVVGVVVDQMRWDYLYRYYDRYSDNGFKRLLNEGFSSENTYIDYVPTYTAIGHSTIYTGSVPAIHGIAGNDFIIQATGESMYCTQDDSVEGVGGGAGKIGKQSPKNLLVSTVTDQLRLATNFQSKVVGIAIKDRGGILPAGHFANAAYWLDGTTGDWITSTYYMKDLPKWVKSFNKEKLADKYFKQGWNTLYPINTYVLSTADDNVYEEPFKGEDKPVFPRNLVKLKKDNGYDLIKATPFGNSLTLDFAKAAIDSEELGANPAGVTDFLAVSLSSTDYVGHQFAINSIEVEDTYLRLDADLGEFLTYLDKKVGKGNYTLFLTADHGAAHNPKYFADQKGNAGYFNTAEARKTLNEKLEKKFGEKDIIKSLTNYQVHLNNALVEEKGLEEEDIREYIVREMKKLEGIAFVTDMDDAASAAIPAKIRERIVNGYNIKRSGVIQYILEPQWYSGKKDSKGTTHGTWGSYDAHIPAVFMGWGVKPGKTIRETHMTDIAPTIAEILKIEVPNGNIGTPIHEAVDVK
ncbi:Type I phosphodiesterase / nucleotide pyrophosphatase [Myroides marinus]|uniref:Calcium-transporting ATPase n=1 Tax=Myroides marinus TaxID=703342 RepID=A0A163Z7Z1_9FLAO|nr:alkaline phosphatase PafA [Myroides marinus]KZE81223.1 nucleotide pyrophosphatase [Myroides marinus]SEI60955.1 Type I phosphodiesterase / nucleotide pyrophosphatase [Myroides marinus]